METRKNEFLRYILEDALTYHAQIAVINEYRGSNADNKIYRNDEDGIEDMLENTDKFEIVRALSFGEYDWQNEFVRFDNNGNIVSFDALWGYDTADVDDVIKWLTEGEGSSSLRDAYMLIDEDGPAEFIQHFVEEIMEVLEYNEDEKDIHSWIEDKQITAEDIFREDWDKLLDDCKEWLKAN